MIQVYADDRLAYDSRMEDYNLEGLSLTNGLNLGGTAEIIMPLHHPAYYFFVSHRTIVTVYRDGKLRFRGRALYPAENFYGARTITCEGELCLLRDGISRPYLYQDTPANIFAAVLQVYNSQVEAFKQFRLGEVTVVDDNDYVRLESENAETTLDTINKLLERCGGYIVFTDAEDGARVINWYATLSRKSRQEIEFGENLLNFTSTGANTTGLATGLVPYGAKDEETGKRLTIESVNDGLDYIMAEDARAVRGTIMATATWDDVTDPANLLRKAQEYLTSCKTFITSLELSALDLSYLDKSLDSFSVGDIIRVKSDPHGINEDFQLTQMTEDLLNPDQSSIVMGKSIQSLTGSDVAGDSKGMNALEATRAEIIADYTRNIQQVATDIERTIYSKFEQDLQGIVLEMSDSFVTRDTLTTLEQTMTGKIQTASNSVLLEVSKSYTTKDEHRTLSGRVETLAGSISLEVTGSLGSEATIVMKADDKTYSKKLDLSKVRQSFANDTSEVVIAAGTITFNSGTLIVNSGNFTLDAAGTITAKAGTIGGWTLMHHKLFAGDGVNIKTVAIQAPQESTLYVFAAGGTSHDSYADCPFRVTKAGKLYATDAVVYGDIITIDGSYKTELDRGSLRLYFSDVLCGTINTKYWSGASTEGISLRVEEGGNYIMFSHADDTQGSGYTVDYYLNAGWSSNYEEMHIFQTSARFLDDVYFAGYTRIRSLRLFGSDGEYLVGISSSGALTVSKL